MSWTVNVAVVPRIGLVLDVSRVDGDTTSLFFRRLINLSIVRELGTTTLSEHFGNGCRQGRLAMINMTCFSQT